MKETSFASLGPTLLARKGGAKPAMRPQLGMAADEMAVESPLEDLGWNDMGELTDQDGLLVNPSNDQPAKVAIAGPASFQEYTGFSLVREQQEAIAMQFSSSNGQELKKAADKQKAKKSKGKRVAFTLRLDPERHFKLRLASMMRETSAQKLLIEMVDRMLEEMTELKEITAKVRQSDLKNGK